MAMNVESKTAILTGAGSGITFCFAKVLLSKDCNVVIADLKLRPESEELLAQYPITSPGAKAIFQKTDVTEWAQMDRMFQIAIKHFGGVDIVCPGAGVYEPVSLSHPIRTKLTINSHGATSGKPQEHPSPPTTPQTPATER
jgi:3-hydroxybutyrate dehydrogenase